MSYNTWYCCKKLGLEILKKTFKILSIDGGGIKGIYSAALLAKFEKLSNQKITDCFDLICGTSTGGLIAILLGAGFSAKEIVDFYRDNASKIFPEHNVVISHIKQLFGVNKHDNVSLRETLAQLLGDKQMKDSVINLCIPSIDCDNEKPVVFKTPHDPNFTRDTELKMLDVALATSAAPTFLPKHKLIELERNMVDGGLWANNPALVGVIEAQSIFFKQDSYENFALLSVGNIDINTGCFTKFGKRNIWNFFFLVELIEFFMHIQSKSVENMVDILKRTTGSTYNRIYAKGFAPKQYSKIQLDTCNSDILEKLIGKGYSDAEHYWADDNIKAYMTSKIKI